MLRFSLRRLFLIVTVASVATAVARLSVLGLLGLTVLFAACGQRGTTGPGQVSAAKEPPLLVAPFDTETAQDHQQAWADHLGAPVQVTNSIGMKLILIPAGEFLMGSPESEEGRRQHRVRITKPFYLGVCEVTQAEYEKVMGENPSEFQGAANPVERVSWDDATEFCRRLSANEGKTYRLPTEAEWEYVCRAGTTTTYSFGDDEASLGEYAWIPDDSDGTTHPVREKKANIWGLHDMYGNVWEWCADWFAKDYYEVSPIDDPQGPSSGAKFRVIRGGSWFSWAVLCRAANRGAAVSVIRYEYVGFRVAAVPSSQAKPK